MILALRPKFRQAFVLVCHLPSGSPQLTYFVFARSRGDRVAFAVHTYLVAEGYKLEAVGNAADQASSAGQAPA